VSVTVALGDWALADELPSVITPAKMAHIGEMDERFQSFNIEMLEVTGGSFWKPYDRDGETAARATPAENPANSSVPAGMNSSMYQYRPPIDLANPRLRKLAAALGPAYMRVSGTWANTTYFHDSDGPAPKTSPKGFSGVLTRQQWKGVVDFSRTVDAELVTSFAISPGTRDRAGVWTPAEAEKVLAYTKSIGGKIAAAEYMNEPTLAGMGGAPVGYDSRAYGRDLAVFHSFMKKTVPDMIILGPGSVGEGGKANLLLGEGVLKSADLLKAAGPVFDVFSYHFYGAASKRCQSMGANAMTSEDAALSEEWLSRTDQVEAFYGDLRDKFEPGKSLWITETADAACGGNPWASTFRDTFRYLDQLGRLAKLGVQVIIHNTLDASDYGLLDENTYAPRPNYWAALLWRRFMGTTVLDPGPSSAPALHLYAHSLRGAPGGVSLLVINTDQTASRSLNVGTAAERYSLTAKDLSETVIQLNGNDLKLGANDTLPALEGTPTEQGLLTFAPTSITFLILRGNDNSNAR
jgi:heparanase